MITACCDHKRQVGRPQTMGKNSMVENIRLLLQDVTTVNIDCFGSLRNWIHEASNEEYWNQLVACLHNPRTPLPEAQKHGDHSHPGAHDETPATNTLLITKATTTMMKMEMTTATITEMTETTNRENTNNPPHHHDEHPPPTRAKVTSPPLSRPIRTKTMAQGPQFLQTSRTILSQS